MNKEDYLEVIYTLIKEKGYAMNVDIASHLHVRASAVTAMMRRLDEDGYVVYEKYRGITLTPDGKKAARSVVNRHSAINRLLRMLGVDEETAQKDTEAIEHDVDPKTLHRINTFLKFAEDNPEWVRKYPPFKEYHEENIGHERTEVTLSTLKHAHELRR
ncbi:transcriptional regulator MntR, partial [Candidatus Bathyarchaeota archaeon]|nr:transcriptional regulator MntR [Candidatus Bathyarchaeota archaeon]